VILPSLHVHPDELRARTGWDLKPEGLCKAERCVLVPPGAVQDGMLDARVLSERLGMALVSDEKHSLWALGPESGGRALTDARAPDVTLPDWHGEPFTLSSLRGRKVLLIAWASW
jgi:hypothetical protein